MRTRRHFTSHTNPPLVRRPRSVPASAGAAKYGRSRFDISDEMDVGADRARNEADMARDELLSSGTPATRRRVPPPGFP